MGEAKRRKKLDASYGNVPSQTSPSQQQKHVDLIVDELSKKFTIQIKQIAGAESMIDGYDSYKQSVFNWLNSKLEPYRQGDRILIASSIMSVYAEIAMQYETSPLFIKFWYDVLESFLADEKRDRIEVIVKKINAEFK
ncbi:MAG: hypothetical protein ACFCAD_04520 [Pleurocapsa sp.]